MRPKFKLLLYCADEQRASRMALVLRLRGYAVSVCEHPDTLRAELLGRAAGHFRVAMVLAADEADHGESAVLALRRHDAELPILAATQGAVTDRSATLMVSGSLPVAELVERLRLLAVRKRGPHGRRTLHPGIACSGGPLRGVGALAVSA